MGVTANLADSPCIKPKKVSTAPDLDDEHADGAQHEAGEDGTTAENLEAVIAPDLSLSKPTAAALPAASTTKCCARRCCAIKQFNLNLRHVNSDQLSEIELLSKSHNDVVETAYDT
jgi:hypothetical protein